MLNSREWKRASSLPDLGVGWQSADIILKTPQLNAGQWREIAIVIAPVKGVFIHISADSLFALRSGQVTGGMSQDNNRGPLNPLIPACCPTALLDQEATLLDISPNNPIPLKNTPLCLSWGHRQTQCFSPSPFSSGELKSTRNVHWIYLFILQTNTTPN